MNFKQNYSIMRCSSAIIIKQVNIKQVYLLYTLKSIKITSIERHRSNNYQVSHSNQRRDDMQQQPSRNEKSTDVNPIKNNETQQRNGTQDRSMDRFEWKTSTRCL